MFFQPGMSFKLFNKSLFLVTTVIINMNWIMQSGRKERDVAFVHNIFKILFGQ